MKTTHRISALILNLSLLLLWAVPILASREINAGWLAIDFGIVASTYLMLAYPNLFSFIPRRNKQILSRAMA
ncbi:hypothetical protein [Nitrosovibrio tenuis]|uniref:Uncharacterized protein n=1 Tax=Nitrosovibrio tenuis TaxID=1233 RepID=A0A1H7H4C4_9PROT|nr:hypothetical protein [Nitrosovibrio tenuis]SEK44607.1 hypothetical protein SAMN05216387_101456 [Nitrosovibrio tenuis]